MNKLSKIAPIVIIIACLGSLFFAFKISSQKKDLKDQNTALTSDKQRLERDVAGARNELQTTKTALAKTTDDLHTANAKLQAAEVSLTEKTQEADGLKAQLDEKNKALDQTKGELSSAQETLKKIQEITASEDFKNIDQIRERLTAQADENKILGRQLAAMHGENKTLKEKVVELSTTPVNLRGRIAAVHDQWGFVILDIGRAQHVTSDAQFLVYRDSKMIGVAHVCDVSANTSVAEMLPEYQRGKPCVGDLVVH